MSSSSSSSSSSSPRLASLLPATLPLLLLAAGCGHGSHGGVVVHDPPSYLESEPNDDVWSANFLGHVAAGDSILVEGHVTDGFGDTLDGFALDLLEPLELRFELFAHDPFADLDVCVYDPVSDVYVACFESAVDPEVGAVAIGLPAEMHLVVSSFTGSSAYSLYVSTAPIAPATLSEPGASGEPRLPRLGVDRAGPRVDEDPRWAPYRRAPGEPGEPDDLPLVRGLLVYPHSGLALPAIGLDVGELVRLQGSSAARP